MTFPIPKDALADRLAVVGTAGSGKTYLALGAIEHLLARKSRVIAIDPLGVMWGLRLCADGKTPSPFQPVIFGGSHGDLPITEHAGAVIGEAVAASRESFIVDLSTLGSKASERRFMLALLTALYRHADREPVHLVIDEADMFAPQKLLDRDGDAARLLGMVETVVRRGRVRGFVPWLITQRPAVLSKDVLSQADGLVALKLTSSQDRKAIRAWVESTADVGQWKKIDAELPAFQRGHGVLWIPGRGILSTVAFPEKATYDSSRAPGHGERRQAATLQPLDLVKLKELLASVEQEVKANDPRELKAKIEVLRKELAATKCSPVIIDTHAVAAARADGYGQGWKDGAKAERFEMHRITSAAEPYFRDVWNRSGAELPKPPLQAAMSPTPPKASKIIPEIITAAAVRLEKRRDSNGSGGLDAPLQKIVDAIRWWNVFGISEPTHPQVAFIAGYRAGSGTWNRYLSSLRSAEIIEPRGPLALTGGGVNAANDPEVTPSGEILRQLVMHKIDAPLSRMLEPIIEAYPRGLEHRDAAVASGYEPGTGTWNRYLSSLRSLELIERRGPLKAQDWLFP